MQKSIEYWILRASRRNITNATKIATDASPAADLQREMNRLARRWTRRFTEAAKRIARWFAGATTRRSDQDIKSTLRKAGWSVDLKMTPPVQDAFTATVEAQVGLIKSIAQEHLADVQGLVMRSVQAGHDAATLAQELQHRYQMTKERAVLIARDQTNKATATITRLRQQSLGITQAIWLHSHGGRKPRPEHVAFAAGRHKGRSGPGPVYEVAKGAYLEDRWTWPGWEINCRCVSKSVLPALKTA